MTVGNTCVVENTPYIAYSPSGEFMNIVSRYASSPTRELTQTE